MAVDSSSGFGDKQLKVKLQKVLRSWPCREARDGRWYPRTSPPSRAQLWGWPGARSRCRGRGVIENKRSTDVESPPPPPPPPRLHLIANKLSTDVESPPPSLRVCMSVHPIGKSCSDTGSSACCQRPSHQVCVQAGGHAGHDGVPGQHRRGALRARVPDAQTHGALPAGLAHSSR